MLPLSTGLLQNINHAVVPEGLLDRAGHSEVVIDKDVLLADCCTVVWRAMPTTYYYSYSRHLHGGSKRSANIDDRRKPSLLNKGHRLISKIGFDSDVRLCRQDLPYFRA